MNDYSLLTTTFDNNDDDDDGFARVDSNRLHNGLSFASNATGSAALRLFESKIIYAPAIIFATFVFVVKIAFEIVSQFMQLISRMRNVQCY